MSDVGGGDYLPPVIAELIGKDNQFRQMLLDAKSDLAEFAAMDPQAQLGADADQLNHTIAVAKASLDIVRADEAFAKIDADDTSFKAKVAASVAALNALSRLTATPTIRPQVEGAGSAAAAAGAGGLLSGAGGIGGILGGLLWGGGAGGIFGVGRGVGAGFGSLGMYAGLGQEHILTTLAGLVGNLGAGAAGGGLLAAGSLATGAVGMGTDMAGVGQAINDTKAYNSAVDNLNKAIAEYGAKSTQAAHAQNLVNYTLSGFPKVAQAAIVSLSQTTNQFKTMFDQLTGPAEKIGAEILQQTVHVAEGFLPTIGKYASENMGIIQKSLQSTFSWISTTGLTDFNVLEAKFQSDLPTAMHAFGQGLEFVVNTLTYLSNFTGGFIHTLDTFFTKMNTPIEFGKWETEINVLIRDFETWKTLGETIIKVIHDIFTQDAGTSTSILNNLIGMLNKLDDWVKTTQGQASVHNLFEVHKQEIQELLQLLPSLISGFGSVYLTVAPTLVQLANLIIPILRDFASNPFGAWILALGLLLSKMNLLGPVLGVVGSGLKALVSSAVINGVPMIGVLGEKLGLIASTAPAAEGALVGVAGKAEGVAKAGVGAAAGIEETAMAGGGLVGPLGIAAGAIIGLGAAYIILHNHSDQTMKQVQSGIDSMNQSLAQIPAGDVMQLTLKLDTVNTDIQNITKSMTGMQQGSKSFNVAAGNLQALYFASVSTTQEMLTMNANVGTLSKTFGISQQDVINFANELGINLKASLDPTQINVLGQAVAASGETFNVAATKPPNWSAAVARSAQQAVNAAKAGNAQLNADAQMASTLHTMIMKDQGLQGVANFINAQRGGLPQVEAVAKAYGITIPNRYLTVLQKAMTSGGTIAVGNLATSMNNLLPKDFAQFGALLQGGMGNLSALAAAGGAQIGASLAGGMGAQLLSQAPGIAASGALVVAQTIGAMHKAAATGSPSRKTRELGGWISEGLSLGMLSGLGEVTASGTAIATRATSSIAAAFTTAAAGTLKPSGPLGGVAGTDRGDIHITQQIIFQGTTPSGSATTSITSQINQANTKLLQALRAQT